MFYKFYSECIPIDLENKKNYLLGIYKYKFQGLSLYCTDLDWYYETEYSYEQKYIHLHAYMFVY